MTDHAQVYVGECVTGSVGGGERGEGVGIYLSLFLHQADREMILNLVILQPRFPASKLLRSIEVYRMSFNMYTQYHEGFDNNQKAFKASLYSM